MGADRAAPAALAREVAGPRPVPDRLGLQGILYVLRNDIAWQLLPLELGFGSGQTCWRRLDRWQKAGVFDRLHRILLAELNAAGELDWSRACVDGSHVRAKKGGTDTGPSPVDRTRGGGLSGHQRRRAARPDHAGLGRTCATAPPIGARPATMGALRSVAATLGGYGRRGPDVSSRGARNR